MRRRDGLIYGITIVLSLIMHVGLFEGLGAAAMNAPPPQQRVLEFAVIEPPPPPPVEEAKPEPPPPPKPKKVDLAKVVPPPPDTPPPANTTEEPAEPAEKARPVFGVSMSSTVGPGNSNFAVRVGNTLMKEPDKEFVPPAEVKQYKPVPLYQVTKMPKPLGECQADRTRAKAFDGVVVLVVEILDDGSVGQVQVKRGMRESAANELAIESIKRCKFAPAEQGSTKVATSIDYTFRFILEE